MENAKNICSILVFDCRNVYMAMTRSARGKSCIRNLEMQISAAFDVTLVDQTNDQLRKFDVGLWFIIIFIKIIYFRQSCV